MFRKLGIDLMAELRRLLPSSQTMFVRGNPLSSGSTGSSGFIIPFPLLNCNRLYYYLSLIPFQAPLQPERHPLPNAESLATYQLPETSPVAVKSNRVLRFPCP